MINVDSLLRQLAVGELKSFSFADGGKIAKDSIPAMVEAINLSLTDLHTRFNLVEKELHILCIASRTQYPLRKKHAINDSTPNVHKYIIDTPDCPFLDDLIQILSVSDEIGLQVSVNDIGSRGSVFLPRYDTVQVTNPTNDKMLAITYQARHPIISLATNTSSSAFLDQEIIIPPILEEALRCRIAYRVYSPMDRENQAAKVALLEQRYEMICQEAEQRNLVNGAAFTTTWKLESRGFV